MVQTPSDVIPLWWALEAQQARRLLKAKQSQAPHIVTGRSRQAPTHLYLIVDLSRLNATPSNNLVPRLRTLRKKIVHGFNVVITTVREIWGGFPKWLYQNIDGRSQNRTTSPEKGLANAAKVTRMVHNLATRPRWCKLRQVFEDKANCNQAYRTCIPSGNWTRRLIGTNRAVQARGLSG